MARHKRRDHDRPLRRRPPSRDPRPRILVLCEGQVTEHEYLEAFRLEEQNQLVEVEVDNQGGSPKTLVERAALRKKDAAQDAERMRDDNLKYDKVWCVFDVDNHPKLLDARQQARDNNICLAISNPCFELWLLLHFCDHTAHVERKPAASLLRKYIKGYNKHVPFDVLRDGYGEAVGRAQHLEKRHSEAGPAGDNPSTTVYKLTEQIRKYGRDARMRA